MAASAILAIKILADAKGAQKGMAQASASTARWSQGMARASRAATVGLAGVGAVALSGVKAAADDAQAQAVLAKALENTAGATKEQVAATEDWISKTALAKGVADDNLRPALANLVRGTGDVTKAQKAMGLALDISAATGADLETVSKAMAKGYGGNTAALGKLVPGLSKAVLKTKDMNKIMAEMQKKVGGTAAKAAETTAGKVERLKVAMDETKESMGAALLPLFERLATLMLKVADFAGKNQKAFFAIAGAIVGIAAAVKIVNGALQVYRATLIVIKAVQAAAFLTNPVFLVVAAVALLVVGIVLLWKRSKTFRKIVTGAFNAVLAVVKGTWAWIKKNWPLLLAVLLGPFGIAAGLIAKNFDKIKGAAGKVGGFVKSTWNKAAEVSKSAFKSAASAVTGFMKACKAAVESVCEGVKAAVRLAVAVFKAVWNAAFAVVRGYFTVWKAVVTGVFNAVKDKISGVASWLSTAFDAAVNTITTVFNTLVDVITAPFDAVISAIQTAIGWIDQLIEKIKGISMPSFSFPDLNPFGRTGASAPGLTAGARGAGRATTSGGGVVYNFTINGAVDPEGVARQIKRIVAGHDRRVGLTQAI